MEITAKRKQIIFVVLFALFLIGFYTISRWSPAAGDDWVYASAGRWNNPFVLTWRMYQIWSGRLLSELWGFTVVVHKSVWNVVNAGLFTAILFLLLRLGVGRREQWTVTDFFLAAALMLSVPDRLRMQTYTWMMGTTYVVPLFLFLLLLYGMRRFQKTQARKWIPCLSLLTFCIPLYMENAAALAVGAHLLWLLQDWCTGKKNIRVHLLFLGCAILGSLVILLSPGAHMRAMDHAAFMSLSIVQKIAQNGPLFLARTFTDNYVLMPCILLLFGAVLGATFSTSILQRIGVFAFFLLAAVLQNGVLDLLAVLIGTIGIALKERRLTLPFIVLCALGANLVMLMSPIFDSRSAIYTVYLWIIAALMLYHRLSFGKWAQAAVLAAAVGFSGVWAARYFQIYHTVRQIALKRDSEIAYYKANPEEKEAWFIGYPDDLIHSPDVLPDDQRHADAFRWYYGLADDVDLHFYYLPTYDAGSIWGERT